MQLLQLKSECLLKRHQKICINNFEERHEVEGQGWQFFHSETQLSYNTTGRTRSAPCKLGTGLWIQAVWFNGIEDSSDYYEKNWIAHNFNHLLQTAGEDWARSFIGMHLTLSVHKPEPVCIFRASGFNKEKVNWFYDVLEPILFKETFTVPAQNIFNVLCTCISLMVICSTNGCGMFIPPMLIFPSG